MDERDVVRVMRTVAGGIAAIVALIAGQAQAADADVARGVSDGTCPQVADGVIPELAGDIDAASRMRPGCVPADSPLRASAEWAEQGHIIETYHRFVEDSCRARECLSNELAAWLLALEDTNDLWVENHVMAGCGMWAELGSNAVVAEKPRYWTIQRVKYVKNDNPVSHVVSQALLGETFHWLVVLTNTRTGEQIALDGWTAAEKARPWLGLGRAADPRKIDPRDEVRSSEDVNSWGHPDGSFGCDNLPGTLCNPTKCGKN